MIHARRILFGIAASTAAVAIVYVSGMLISAGLTRKYAMLHPGDTYFVVMHWHPWVIVCIAFLSFALGFFRTSKTR